MRVFALTEIVSWRSLARSMPTVAQTTSAIRGAACLSAEPPASTRATVTGLSVNWASAWFASTTPLAALGLCAAPTAVVYQRPAQYLASMPGFC